MNKIDQAFHNTPRSYFLPNSVRKQAPEDRPLPIGYGQTNSQPSTVRQMLEWLDVQVGDRVLDVGSGSGWTTALLAHLTGSKGKVVAIEKIPELVTFGQQNCAQLNLRNTNFHQATDTLGWPPEAPYDRILVSAGAKDLPFELLNQLKPGGKMVIPVRGSILEVETDNTGEAHITRHSGFIFVPLL